MDREQLCNEIPGLADFIKLAEEMAAIVGGAHIFADGHRGTTAFAPVTLLKVLRPMLDESNMSLTDDGDALCIGDEHHRVFFKLHWRVQLSSEATETVVALMERLFAGLPLPGCVYGISAHAYGLDKATVNVDYNETEYGRLVEQLGEPDSKHFLACWNIQNQPVQIQCFLPDGEKGGK